MKTIMKNFTLVLMMLLVSVVLYSQPHPGNCVGENEAFRNTKDSRVEDPQITPFNDTDLSEFKALFYYPIDCNYIYEAKFKPIQEKKVNVDITGGGTIQLYEVGTAEVIVDGAKKDLVVYKNIDMPEFNAGTYFIPIKDGTTTSGMTFANGRYVVIGPKLSKGKFQLDFNRAINPYENYNSGEYNSLIISGDANTMAAPLTVGERKYEDRTR